MGSFPTFPTLKVQFELTLDSINSLNSLTSACNEKWVLNPSMCPKEDSGTCNSISSTSSIDISRDCLEKPDDVLKIFELLRSSYLSQSSLMKTLIQNFSDLTGETPHSKVIGFTLII